jgi:hypothetical protein
MKPEVMYKQLRDELERLGWKDEPLELDAVGGTTKTHSTLFRNSETNLYILLPRMRPSDLVEPIHLLRVRNVLENAGFWDSLVRQTQTNGHAEAVHVLQTLAGIKTSK